MNDERPFGLQLYDGLRESGHLEVLTAQLNYADIQRLKKADREDVIKLFRGYPYAFLQRLKNDSPEELAKLITLEAEAAAAAHNDIDLFPLFILNSL
ncbi:MAG: hypothetical protein ACYTGL_02450 [Planctomycetota bacterium]|jgi:hypothetical protein